MGHDSMCSRLDHILLNEAIREELHIFNLDEKLIIKISLLTQITAEVIRVSSDIFPHFVTVYL